MSWGVLILSVEAHRKDDDDSDDQNAFAKH